jgi:hypothetical protein
MKVGAKWAELVQLMQKFVPQSYVGIYAMNSPGTPPPVGPSTHVLVYFGSFCYCMKVGAKWAKLVKLMHKFVQ